MTFSHFIVWFKTLYCKDLRPVDQITFQVKKENENRWILYETKDLGEQLTHMVYI